MYLNDTILSEIPVAEGIKVRVYGTVGHVLNLVDHGLVFACVEDAKDSVQAVLYSLVDIAIKKGGVERK